MASNGEAARRKQLQSRRFPRENLFRGIKKKVASEILWTQLNLERLPPVAVRVSTLARCGISPIGAYAQNV